MARGHASDLDPAQFVVSGHPDEHPTGRIGYRTQGLPTHDIGLETRLSDIPEGDACYLCDAPTEKAYLEHFSSGSTVRVRAREAAGYRCPSCGIASFSHEAMLEALTKARDLMRQRGDIVSADNLEASIDRHRAAIRAHRAARR